MKNSVTGVSCVRRAAVVSVAGVLAAGAGVAAAAPQAAVHASTVKYVAFPDPGLSNYDIAGRYPQVVGSNVAKVNAAIRSAFVSFEKSYAKQARQVGPSPVGGDGIFDVTLAKTSASTSVLSTLIGLDTVFPGGNDGQRFLSLTVTAPAGRPVTFTQLVTNKPAALAALAAAAKRQVLAANSCVADSLNVNMAGFAPTSANYAHWVLLPQGFRVGFDQGQLSIEACGYVSTLVPWPVLRPYLSPLGKQLVAGLRGERDYTLTHAG